MTNHDSSHGPAPDDSDVGEELRHAVEGTDGTSKATEERDEPAFDSDEGMQVPPPG